MEKRILLIGIILGSTIFLMGLPNAKAAKYSYNVETGNDKIGMQYIYEIKSWDKDAAEDIFGSDNIKDVLGDGAKVGSMPCTNLYDAYSSHKGWDIGGFYSSFFQSQSSQYSSLITWPPPHCGHFG